MTSTDPTIWNEAEGVGMGEDPGQALARLLHGLKERSGLSYGLLARRLHVSPSTLHRYCSGQAVPAAFTTVEHFARLCRAGPEETLAAHRLWVEADAARALARTDASAQPPPEPSTPTPPAGSRAEPLAGSPAGSVAGPLAGSLAGSPDGPLAGPPAGSPTGAPAEPLAEPAAAARRASWRRSGPVAATTAAVLAVSGAAALVSSSLHPRPDTPGTPTTVEVSVSPAAPTEPAPFDVDVRSHAWADPCQAYLVDRPPAQVAPPPPEQDAASWVGAQRAVPDGRQYLAVTVQGSGRETVVLQHLYVTVVTRGAALPWPSYRMDDGCGADLSPRTFTVDLDRRHPAAVLADEQCRLPLRASESEPAALYVSAATRSSDVQWYLELEWSSGKRRGTVRIDDHGRPFRTSGHRPGAPSYGPVGAQGAWVAHR